MMIAELGIIKFRILHSAFRIRLVGLDRFELSTSRLSGVRSNQLSYRPSLYRMAYSLSPWEFRRAIDP
jgi:hypothetical protein